MTPQQQYKRTKKVRAVGKLTFQKYYAANWTTSVTQERYNAMMDKQSGACGICGGNRGSHALGPDHNHETGEVRDLLCGPCNSALGLAGDSVELLKKMVAYLERHNGEPSRLCPE